MTFDPENVMWTEKYRPKKISEMVGNFKDKITKHLENPQAMQHLLLHSKTPGTGKTTLAKAIINELGADYKTINSSDDRKIETIREIVKGFASTKSSKDGMRRIIFLDEADGMLKASQEALRNIMETYATNALFILTCNNVDKIHAAIRSRCLEIPFSAPAKEEMVTYLEGICDKEKMDWSEEGMSELIDKNYPSIRNCVQALQDMKIEGLSVIPENVKQMNAEFDDVWNDIVIDKDYKKLRTYIFESAVDARELNLYFWKKAWLIDNQRLIQITCKNEMAIAQGADSKVIFATSLIEMCK